MVVEQIDIERIAILEPEDNAPVGGNVNRPKALQLALERVEPEAWGIPSATVGATSERLRMRRTLATWSGRMRLRSPCSKRRFSPRCRKLRIAMPKCNL
jgi:hypothetical protein